MASHALSAQNLFTVKGNVALVTGGATGIGLMISTALAANGAKVYIASRRKDVVERVALETKLGSGGGSLVPFELDVTSKESIRKAVAAIEAADGKLDILINNSGQGGPKSPFFSDPQSPQQASAGTLGQALFDNESFEDWAAHFTVNVSSIFFVTTAFLGLLSKAAVGRQGHTASVINIGSISGIMKLCQDHFAYNTAKAAVHHLTKMMSTEFALKKYPIRVNAIAPGAFPSEMTPYQGKHWTLEQVNKVTGTLVDLPSGTVGQDEDMAAAVLYLASPGGYYVNGQVIVPDGGFVAVNPAIA